MKFHIRISTIVIVLVMLFSYGAAYRTIGDFTCLFQQPKLIMESSQTDFFPPAQYDFDTLTKPQAYELTRWAVQWGTYMKNQFPILQKSFALLRRRVPTFAQFNVSPLEVVASKEMAEKKYKEWSDQYPSMFPKDPSVLDAWSDEQKHDLLSMLFYRSNINSYGLAQLPIVQKALELEEPIEFRPMTKWELEREIRYRQQLLNVQVLASEQNGSDVLLNWNYNIQDRKPPIDIPESVPMTEEQALTIMAWATYCETLKRYQFPVVQRAAALLDYDIPTPEECAELLQSSFY